MKADAYGGVVVHPDKGVLLREPKNHFDGYVWTFAKGRMDSGERPEQTALREVEEETGVRARILAPIPGVFEGGTTDNAYFLMEVLEEKGEWHWETESVRWTSFDDAVELIGRSTNALGRKRDLDVLAVARRMVEEGSFLPAGGPAD